MKKQKTFRTVGVLAHNWRVSELWIWALSITGWEAVNGKHRRIERIYDKHRGAMFAEEDLQSWVDSHPAEYVRRTMPM
jgi:hypothetical protein